MTTALDRDLGMRRRITRRDFINGVAIPVGGALVLPRWAAASGQAPAPEQAADYYPPAQTGLRGSHDGSWEVGHQMRDRRGWDLAGATDTGERYDLVVVGGRDQRARRRALLPHACRPRGPGAGAR